MRPDAVCEIGDVAPDTSITEFLNKFLAAVHLRAVGAPEAYARVIEDLGLADDYETLLQLENIVQAKIQKQRDEGSD
jgi:hypothetical protein